jgi:uncharacterized membrane protein YcaP (DUF421 family)
MNPAFHPDEWGRILIGDVPPSFLLEALIRTVVLFAALVFSLRMMGRKMAAKLTRNEMAAIVTLAAAVGIPLQAPERGLLPGLLICALVIGVHTAISRLSMRSARFENLTHGDLEVLVADGVLQLESLHRSRISLERLMAHLRSEQLFHLGQVQRLYLESNGQFSLLRAPDPGRPGLSVLPQDDPDFAREKLIETGQWVCLHCGTPRRPSDGHCRRCAEPRRAPALTLKEA